MMLDLGAYLPMISTGHALVGKVETKLPLEAVTELDLSKLTIKSLIETPKTVSPNCCKTPQKNREIYYNKRYITIK